MVQLRLQPQSIKKEGLTITVYYTKLKEISDELVMARHMVSKEDFIMYLLQSLHFEYNVVVANVNSHCLPLEIEEVLTHLFS